MALVKFPVKVVDNRSRIGDITYCNKRRSNTKPFYASITREHPCEGDN